VEVVVLIDYKFMWLGALVMVHIKTLAGLFPRRFGWSKRIDDVKPWHTQSGVYYLGGMVQYFWKHENVNDVGWCTL